ncbi:MAG TPA: hypothetical protein EYN66_07340 [Myxococcales bacterium]|nr:hypothetical protein [Myxococcales bacterium]
MLTHQQIFGIIEAHKTKTHKERKQWDKYRSWYLSEYWGSQPDQATGSGDEESGLEMETNFPYAWIDTMVANVCPTNPQVTVNARRKKLAPAARFREALVNDTLRRNKAHSVLWKMATQTAICGRSFTKGVWNFKRNAVEFIPTDPRFIFFDMGSVRWSDIRYICEVTVLTKAEFNSRVRGKGRKSGTYNPDVAKRANFGGYPKWLKDNWRNKAMLNEASREVYEWTTVYEFYDFEAERYYHFGTEGEEPLFEGELPYRFMKNPFQMLTFNDNMSDMGGLSDVKLIASAQERLNELDTLELVFAQSTIPVMLVQAGLVDNPEQLISALRDADGPGAMVNVQGKQNAPLRDIIGSTPTAALSPSFDKMRDRAMRIVEFVLGIPQYSRGVVGVSDVATEVALADTATRTRNGRRIKAVEDVVSWMAQCTVGLYEEFFSEDMILPVRLTGSREVLEVTRESLIARDARDEDEEHPLDYDYEALPYSPSENNRLVQLKNVGQFMEFLMQAPQVDKERLVQKMLELLQLGDISLSKAEQEAQQQAEAQAQPPQGPPGMVPPPPGGDTIATGALPPGTEPVSPVGGPGALSEYPGFAGAPGGFEGAPFAPPGS